LLKVQNTEADTSDDETIRVIDLLGKLHTCFSIGEPLIESALLGETPHQPGTRHHRGQTGHIKALALQVTSERGDIMQEEIDGPWIIAESVVGLA
jgi:hypothetical protein